MTDLQARLVAAIQQVRTSTPHTPGCPARCGTWQILALGGEHERFALACGGPEVCDWAARVDARLAVCVEAAIEAAGTAQRRSLAFLLDPTAMDDSHIVSFEAAGLAAFLAAAAQKETTK